MEIALKVFLLFLQVVTDATRFTMDLHEIEGSHSYFKIISNKQEHKVIFKFGSIDLYSGAFAIRGLSAMTITINHIYLFRYSSNSIV